MPMNTEVVKKCQFSPLVLPRPLRKLGKKCGGAVLWQLVLHSGHIFNVPKVHKLPNCMQAQARSHLLPGMDAKQ